MVYADNLDCHSFKFQYKIISKALVIYEVKRIKEVLKVSAARHIKHKNIDT